MNLDYLSLTYEAHSESAAVHASIGDTQVGTLEWSTIEREYMPVGSIMSIWVERPCRRQGIATMMLAEARKHDPRVCHHASRTPLGNKWAKSTGEPLPKLEREPPYIDDVVHDEWVCA